VSIRANTVDGEKPDGRKDRHTVCHRKRDLFGVSMSEFLAAPEVTSSYYLKALDVAETTRVLLLLLGCRCGTPKWRDLVKTCPRL
jgi:hypothetical protein